MTTEAATRRLTGAPCWVSLLTHRLAATQEFYGALFGWEFRPGPQHLGPYRHAVLDGREVAGLGEPAADRRLPVSWTTYLATEDVDATAERIRYCGGTVGVGPLDTGGAGRMALACDPQGAVFGIWQGRAATATAAAGEPGTPVWNELITRETHSAGPFYEHVFGYESQAVVSADFDYLTLRLKGHPVAGLHGVGNALPREAGPRWMTYFAVSDTDAAVRRVEGLGGHVVRPPRDSPHGRLATVTDPGGAAFTVIRPAPEGIGADTYE
ncbi:VOC family protein [Streptomyces catenulae]|uniref:VOC family protein n=1 Tax=Streptomyces catenulae TaxID=66875 RepID=A0ABV2Z1P8_9ACTN|nr:VOC family protein [Streptomyces catenulae]